MYTAMMAISRAAQMRADNLQAYTNRLNVISYPSRHP
jgi:hypothetical protein